MKYSAQLRDFRLTYNCHLGGKLTWADRVALQVAGSNEDLLQSDVVWNSLKVVEL